MRSSVIFLLLLVSAGLFVVLQITRDIVPHQVTLAAALPAPAPGTGMGGKGEPPGSKDKAKAKDRNRSEPIRAPAIRPAHPRTGAIEATPPKPKMKRPLRVIGLGWELVTPGVVANDGSKAGKGSLFARRGL